MLKWAKPTYCRQETKDGRYWVCKSLDGGDMNQRWSAHRIDLDEPLLTCWSRTRWEAKRACQEDHDDEESKAITPPATPKQSRTP